MTLVECPAAKQSVGRALGHQHIPPNLWPERNFGFGTYAVNEVGIVEASGCKVSGNPPSDSD